MCIFFIFVGQEVLDIRVSCLCRPGCIYRSNPGVNWVEIGVFE